MGQIMLHLLHLGPVEDPQISVIVFVEKGGKGSAVAAPIARQILEKYFSKHKKEDYGLVKKMVTPSLWSQTIKNYASTKRP